MRKVSKRRSAQVQEYNRRVHIWKIENPYCKANVPGCTRFTIDCHHMKGKIELLLLEEKYWLPVCRNCHNYIESHPAEALEKVWSLLRLSKD